MTPLAAIIEEAMDNTMDLDVTFSHLAEASAAAVLAARSNNLALAIARLADNPARHLRPHYLELTFLFDRFDDQTEATAEGATAEEYRDAIDRAEEAEWKISWTLDLIDQAANEGNTKAAMRQALNAIEAKLTET